MGLLGDGYYSQAVSRQNMPPTTPPPTQPAPAPASPSLNTKPTTQVPPDVAALEQNAAHPYRSNLGLSLGGAVGLKLPDQYTWQGMSAGQKAAAVASAVPGAIWNTIKSLPQEIVKAPTRYALSVGDTWGDVLSGKKPTFESLQAKPVREIPWLGAVPNYFQTYDEARKSGLGPKASLLVAGNTAVGDITIGASLAEDIGAAFKPRAKTAAGLPAIDAKPIQSALEKGQAEIRSVRRPVDTPNEYYTLPQEVAKKHGGSSSDTFLKVSPSGFDGSVEVSVVQTRAGALQRFSDKVRGAKTYRGDFGPEVKLESKIVSAPGGALVEGARAEGAPPALVMPKALKGFEDAPATGAQVSQLEGIVSSNGINGDVANTVMRSVTGKSSVGELTQQDFVTLSKVYSGMNRMNQVSDTLPAVNPLGQYLSPQRRWMRDYEEKSGGAVPLYSEAYVPMEDAMRARKVFRDQHRADSREIFGKYAGPGFSEERRLVKSYMEGDTAAIDANPALDAATKSDLAGIADKMRQKYNDLGPVFGIDSQYFLDNYQPHIQNIGGVYQLYKDGRDIPKELSFFAEKKRTGSFAVQVDDALALFDIYLNAGSNKVFVNPALQRVAQFADSLPSQLKGSLQSYVGEKIGYAGKVEEYINQIAPEMNRRLGTNLPPDLGRQLTQTMMDTTYAGALGVRPAAVVRNLLQAPLMTYPRLGPRFYADAVKMALTKEGQAELARRGFSVDLGLPYGEELTKEITLGGKAQTLHRNLTQSTLKPYSLADNINRGTTFWQSKMIWDDAMSKYRAGQITWDQFEKSVDFGSFRQTDRNIMRKALVAGNEDAAFNHYVRDIMDDTQFPYRRGASSRITYGFAGRLLTQFSQWNTEFAHTVGSWIRGGQMDKLIRFAAASYATQRTLQNTFGVDVTNWTGLNPLNPTASPFVQFAGDVLGMMQAVRDNNRQAMNDNRDLIVRQAKALGFPGGVQGQRVANFLKSYNAGPDENGMYKVYSQTGGVTRRADFNDLWWDTLWGFPSAENVKQQNLGKEMRNAQEDYSQAKQQALQFYQQGKYDEANQIVTEYGIKIGPKDFDANFIPYNERLFNSLPGSLKAQFAPRVYPQKP